MSEIIDKTDKFTSHRSISTTFQEQIGKKPLILVNVLLFGDSEPLISGTGSFKIQLHWQDLDQIPELAHARNSIAHNQVKSYENFHCLINGQPSKIGNGYQIVKIAATDSTPEALGFFISCTVDDFRRIAFANSVDCRIDVLEFEFGQNVREGLAKIVSLVGDVKTLEQQQKTSNENKMPISHVISGSTSQPVSNVNGLIVWVILGLIFVGFLLSKCSTKNESSVEASPNSDAEVPVIQEPVVQQPIQTERTYTSTELKAMISKGVFPEQNPPVHDSQNMYFSECAATVKSSIESVQDSYPAEIVVNSNVMIVGKIWANDGAVVMTCSEPDQKLLITKSSYR